MRPKELFYIRILFLIFFDFFGRPIENRRPMFLSSLVSLFVSHTKFLKMSNKRVLIKKKVAFFYKNFFLVARLKIGDLCFWVRLFVSLFVSWSHEVEKCPTSFFYKNIGLKIFWIFTIVNISTLREFFFNFFFKCPKWTRSQLWDVSYVLVFIRKKF